MKNKKKLVIQQLDKTLNRFRPVLDISIPMKGWIRAVRSALGMNGSQFARRLNVTRQRISQIEEEELAGSTTLKTMRRLAERLDCRFVYGFVPKTSLAQTVRDQARKVAKKRLSQASRTMALEDQALSKEENDEILVEMVDELADTLPSTLWDES